MSVSMLIMVALVGVLLLVVIALSYRLWKLRQVGGTAAILRDVPGRRRPGLATRCNALSRWRSRASTGCRVCGGGPIAD